MILSEPVCMETFPFLNQLWRFLSVSAWNLTSKDAIPAISCKTTVFPHEIDFWGQKNRRKGPTSLLYTNLSIHSDLKHHDWFSRWENHREQVSKTSGACCFQVPQNAQTSWDVTIGTKFQDAFECDSCVPKVPFGPTVAATQSNLGVAVGRCGILWDPCSSPKL